MNIQTRKSILEVGEDRVVYDGQFITVTSREFTNIKKNKKGVWEVVNRKGTVGNVVGVLGVTENLEAILVNIYRVPLKSWIVQLCYGGAKEGEKEETAAGRELIEETGYRAEKMEKLFEGPFNPAITDEVAAIYLATGSVQVHKGRREAAEDIDVLLFPLKSAVDELRRISQDILVDIKVYGALYAAMDLLLGL